MIHFIKRYLLVILGSLSLVFLTVVANLFVHENVNLRADLTAENKYTLSDNSIKLLRNLDTSVNVTFYFSELNNNMPIELRNYSLRIKDFLKEYDSVCDKLTVSIVNPIGGSDEADAALFDGLQPLQGIKNDTLFFGLVVNCLDKSVAINRLIPSEEDIFEYKLTRAINQVHRGVKPKVGIISPFPVLGEEVTIEMVQAKRKPSPSWLVFKELNKDFTLLSFDREMQKSHNGLDKKGKVDKFFNSIDVLLVVHPQELSKTVSKAIDAYIVQGGQAAVFVDPYSMLASGLLKTQKFNLKKSSNFPRFFETWGVGYTPTEVVADNKLGRRVKKEAIITLLDFFKMQINNDNVVTGLMDHLTMVFAGHLDTSKLSSQLESTVLVQSTADSQIVPSEKSFQSNQLMAAFKADKEKYDMGILLTGKFPAVFPENSKLESSRGSVYLFADSDLIYDQVCSVKAKNEANVVYDKLLNDNISLVQNIVEYLSGDKSLIGIRSRQVSLRPLVRFLEMQTDADKRFKDKVMAKQKELIESDKILKKFDRMDKTAGAILSKEDKEQYNAAKVVRARLIKDLNKATSELERDVELEKSYLKWMCTILMPAVLLMIGLIVLIIKTIRCSAK